MQLKYVLYSLGAWCSSSLPVDPDTCSTAAESIALVQRHAALVQPHAHGDTNQVSRTPASRQNHQQENSNMHKEALLSTLQDVASSLTEGSTTVKTQDSVDDALAAVSAAMTTVPSTIAAQAVALQQQLEHAASAVNACHTQDGISLREREQLKVDTRVSALQTCQEELDVLAEEATSICAIAEDCSCDELNERHSGKQALCDQMTETYEIAYCKYRLLCDEYHNCHESESEVYSTLKLDVEAEMAVVEQEYISTSQSTCLVDLIMTAMASGTPIDSVAMVACETVDTSAFALIYPELPETPAECTEPPYNTVVCE